MCGRSLPLAGKEEQAEREQAEVGLRREGAPVRHRRDHTGSASHTVARCSTPRPSRPPRRALCDADPGLAAIVERHGLPEFWAREPGLETLVLLILEQQVSLASARAAYDRLEQRLGGLTTAGILASSDAELRADGFSRQKARYVRALATAVEDGSLDLSGAGDARRRRGTDRARRAARHRAVDGRRLPPLGPPAPGRLAGRRHRAPGGRAARARPRAAPDAARARGARRGVAAPSRERRPAALAPVPQRAEALVSAVTKGR